ncbi:F-box/LRR-repeat protein 2 [Culex quinquefasciatus]|uniref:F-box/LRR-repeat protein 2 n=1 Tax=Culex quinquefasciatus TaxID=7176 RepID=UPI0018E39485|nr:F-box/LRR-repeat protein 2 [Culex quinquefasciatus]
MEAAELPPLSGRILERIFRHLSAFQLARARLTCRQWNEVITGSPQLVAKFRLSLERFFCGGETERDFMLENVKTCYSTADYGASHLIQVEHVWVTVGPNIRHLIIHDCWLDLSKVGYMLRYLPNLEELTFTPYYLESDMIKDVKIDYRMDKLATLTIGSTDRIDEVLDLFKQICSNLVVLRVCCKKHDCNEEKLLNLIFASRDTLQEISLKKYNFEDEFLTKISSMDRLELKRLSLKQCYIESEEDIFNLSLAQPLLEHLDIQSAQLRSNEVLVKIAQNLPYLRSLKINLNKLKGSLLDDSLNCMPALEHLKLLSERPKRIDISKFQNSNLAKLSLSSVTLTMNTLEGITNNLPKLKTLTLECSEHKSPIPQSVLESLKSLKLKQVTNLETTIYPTKSTWNLKHLQVISCDLSGKLLQSICQQCPLLETVHLESTYYVCDRDVQLLCRTLKRLRSLSLVDCRLVSDVTVENVIVHCLKLEYLRIEYCRKVEKNRRWYQTEMKPRFKISIGPECWYKDS